MTRTVRLRKISIPLREPFRISNGEVRDRESLIIEVEENGHRGWGEAAPMPGPFYSQETPDSCWVALERWIIPLWINEEFEHPSEVGPFLEQIPGEGFGRAGLEGACWDLACQAAGKPLWKMLGSELRPIESGAAIGIFDTHDELLERVGIYARQGYRRTKIKIQPGWDIEPVRLIRERFGEIPLMVDANAAYGIGDLAIFQELDKFNLMMFEQPMKGDALDEMAELRRNVKTPVCADESAESLEALDRIIELGAADIINIKVQRVGGLTAAKRMYEKSRDAGLGIWLGTMPELGIASVQALHLGTLPGFGFPTDVEASERWYRDDIIDPFITIDPNGMIHLPAGAGMGYRVDRAKLEQYTEREAEFSA